jgi:hypothetical protein
MVHGGAGAPPAVHGSARARLKKRFGGLKKGGAPIFPHLPVAAPCSGSVNCTSDKG